MDGVSLAAVAGESVPEVMTGTASSWGGRLQHCSVMSRSAVDHFMASVPSNKQNAAAALQ